MGSPGTFIHSGRLGGRLSELESTAPVLPIMPEARAAPPITAPLRKNRRRDVVAESSIESVTRRSPLPPRLRIGSAQWVTKPTASSFIEMCWAVGTGAEHQVSGVDLTFATRLAASA